MSNQAGRAAVYNRRSLGDCSGLIRPLCGDLFSYLGMLLQGWGGRGAARLKPEGCCMYRTGGQTQTPKEEPAIKLNWFILGVLVCVCCPLQRQRQYLLMLPCQGKMFGACTVL